MLRPRFALQVHQAVVVGVAEDAGWAAGDVAVGVAGIVNGELYLGDIVGPVFLPKADAAFEVEHVGGAML